VAENAVPIRTAWAYWYQGGLRNKVGSLLLYPDQLVYVGSKVAQIGRRFGIVGTLATQKTVHPRAAGKVAAGHKSVVPISLTSISEVSVKFFKLGGKSLIVRTASGSEYRFWGVNSENWLADVRNIFTDSGRTVTPIEDGFSVH
jgi:hypothetical protein